MLIEESRPERARRLGRLSWTVLVCTLGAVLRVLEEYLPVGGRIAAFILDLSWSPATVFAVGGASGFVPRGARRACMLGIQALSMALISQRRLRADGRGRWSLQRHGSGQPSGRA